MKKRKPIKASSKNIASWELVMGKPLKSRTT
jgi:hypothetical protein